MESSRISLFVLIITVPVTETRANGEGLYTNTPEGMTFGEIKPFDIPPVIEKAVWFFEEDVSKNREYLIADGSALKVFDYDSRVLNQRIIIGDSLSDGYREGMYVDARFNTITGFAQVNESHILVVDSNNHCLRYVARGHRRALSTHFTGQCETPGMVDGLLSEVKFNTPKQIFVLSRQTDVPATAYITDSGNNMIRSHILGSDTVETLVELSQSPVAMTTEPGHLWLFVTTSTQVLRIVVSEKKVIPIVSSSIPGFQDGSFETALIDHPTAITHMSRETLIIAEPSNNRLRVIDRDSRLVTSVCTGEANFTDTPTDIETCQLFQPVSLSQSFHEFVLIGMNSSEMRILEFKRLFGRWKTVQSSPPPTRIPNPPRRKNKNSITVSSSDEEDGNTGSMDPSVTIAIVVTAGIAVVVMIIAVAVIFCKKYQARKNRMSVDSNAAPDTSTKFPSTGERIAMKSGLRKAVSNTYSNYEEMESTYHTIDEIDVPYYISVLPDEQPADKQRYAPLPSPSRSKLPTDDGYCNPTELVVMDEQDNEEPIKSSNTSAEEGKSDTDKEENPKGSVPNSNGEEDLEHETQQ